MSKGLEELKRMAYENACCRCQYYIDKKCTNNYECVWKTIEQELKQAEENEKMLNVFKNALTIEHHDYPMAELDHSKDTMSCFVKELTTIKQNELDKSMRKSLREWVLKNAFPKEIKALNEIVTLHDKWLGNEMSDFEFFTLLVEIKDKYGLTKEVLL